MCGTAQPKAAPPGVWAGNRNDCAALRLKAPDMMPDDDQRNSRIGEPPLPNSNSRRPARSSADLTVRRELSRLGTRSDEHTSELQSLMRISYAVFCLQKK